MAFGGADCLKYAIMHTMQKKIYILIGIIVMLVLSGLLFWVFSRSDDQPAGLKQVVKMDCATAQVPFACYLDKAMAAKDPGLCMNAGAAKRLDCLEAYKEIMGVKVDCAVIQDADFQRECIMVSQGGLIKDREEGVDDSQVESEMDSEDERFIERP